MKLGTRVKVKQSALAADIKKILEGDAELEDRFTWIFYLSALYNEEGVVDGLFPDEEAPPGTLLVRWESNDPQWTKYLNEDEDGSPLYGWFEDELEEIAEGPLE